MTHSDYDWLKETNIKIGEAEWKGDQTFFEDLLSSAFAFRRADGSVVDRQTFIASVKQSAERLTNIESVSFFGDDRALVTCVVRMHVEGEDRSFHNMRLFVRDPERRWMLLGWANERV